MERGSGKSSVLGAAAALWCGIGAGSGSQAWERSQNAVLRVVMLVSDMSCRMTDPVVRAGHATFPGTARAWRMTASRRPAVCAVSQDQGSGQGCHGRAAPAKDDRGAVPGVKGGRRQPIQEVEARGQRN